MAAFPSFQRLKNIPLYEYNTFYLSIHLSIDIWLFPPLGIMDNAALNMDVPVSLQEPAFSSFGYISISRISGTYCNSIFNSLRNYHTVFHCGYTILHSYQQYRRILISPQAHLHLLFEVTHCGFDTHFPNCVMISDVEHLFMCVLAICISSLEKCLFKSYA